MTKIESIIDTDFPKNNIASFNWKTGEYETIKDYERRRARVFSKPLPVNTFSDLIKFYARKPILKMKYDLAMYALEEKTPLIYKTLTFIGFPEPPKNQKNNGPPHPEG